MGLKEELEGAWKAAWAPTQATVDFARGETPSFRDAVYEGTQEEFQNPIIHPEMLAVKETLGPTFGKSDEEMREFVPGAAFGAGAIGGAAFGPIGALAGPAVGWGGSLMYGDPEDSTEAFQNLGYGAAGGLGGVAAGNIAPASGGSSTVTSAAGTPLASSGVSAVPVSVAAPSGVGAMSGATAGAAEGVSAAQVAAGAVPCGATLAPSSVASGTGPVSGASSGGAEGISTTAPNTLPTGGTMANKFNTANMLASLGKGYLGYQQTKNQQDLLQPDIDARNRAMARYEELLANPNIAYENDPGLRQARHNRMQAVEARQLKGTGGTRGKAYSQQLMRESADIDAGNLQRLLNSNLAMMGQGVNAQNQMMGLGGGRTGAAAATAVNVMDDVMFQQFLNEMMG